MPRSRILLILLICVAMLAMRIGNAHLHLCLDGQGPPASVHYGDDGFEAGHAMAGPAHHDYDYDIGGNSLGKLSKVDLAGMALLVTLLFGLFRRQPSLPATWQLRFRAPVSNPYYLRPPSCGPPLISLV